jgi:hypothetical protein
MRHVFCAAGIRTVFSSFVLFNRASYGLFVHGFNVSLYAVFLALLTYLVVSGVQSQLLPNLKRESLRHVNEYSPSSNMTFDDEDPRKYCDVCLIFPDLEDLRSPRSSWVKRYQLAFIHRYIAVVVRGCQYRQLPNDNRSFGLCLHQTQHGQGTRAALPSGWL